MCRRYGTAFEEQQVGRIEALGVSFPFYSPTNRYLRKNYRGIVYEPGMSAHLAKHYASSPICFVDIGAHHGYFSALVRHLSSGSTVYAFEPDPKSFAVLEKNFAINSIQGEAVQLALSDEVATIPFEGPSMNVDQHAVAARVAAQPFDSWSDRHGVRPDLVKIDVHGAEGKVLFGMQRALATGEFGMYLEVHPQDMLVDYTLDDIVSLILDNGFEIFEIPNFRGDQRPYLQPVDEGMRRLLVAPETWTAKQTKKRRMLYCSKARP